MPFSFIFEKFILKYFPGSNLRIVYSQLNRFIIIIISPLIFLDGIGNFFFKFGKLIIWLSKAVFGHL